MVKSGGNSIDMSRDPRRQPLPKRPEPSAVADRIGTVKKTKKVSPKPSSKSDSKATTAVPSAAERSNQESKTKVATVGSKEKKSCKISPHSTTGSLTPIKYKMLLRAHQLRNSLSRALEPRKLQLQMRAMLHLQAYHLS